MEQSPLLISSSSGCIGALITMLFTKIYDYFELIRGEDRQFYDRRND